LRNWDKYHRCSNTYRSLNNNIAYRLTNAAAFTLRLSLYFFANKLLLISLHRQNYNASLASSVFAETLHSSGGKQTFVGREQ